MQDELNISGSYKADNGEVVVVIGNWGGWAVMYSVSGCKAIMETQAFLRKFKKVDNEEKDKGTKQ